jgi:hypothetical protein
VVLVAEVQAVLDKIQLQTLHWGQVIRMVVMVVVVFLHPLQVLLLQELAAVAAEVQKKAQVVLVVEVMLEVMAR